MRALLQRVNNASVRVDGEVIAEIGSGLLVLLGVAVGDGEEEARWLADKVAGLRIFADDEGRMNRSVLELGGAILAVSQFTLYADTRNAWLDPLIWWLDRIGLWRMKSKKVNSVHLLPLLICWS